MESCAKGQGFQPDAPLLGLSFLFWERCRSTTSCSCLPMRPHGLLLLGASEVEGAKLTDLSVTLEGPAISMPETSPNLDGDDFEAVAFGVQADFAERETPSAQASEDEDEKGEETEALRVLDGLGVDFHSLCGIRSRLK